MIGAFFFERGPLFKVLEFSFLRSIIAEGKVLR
jgi:hypothetical protein